MSPLCFVLINQSTLTDPQYGGALDGTTLQAMADSLAAYLNEDVATYWGGVYQVRVGAPDASDLAPGEVGSYIVDSLAQFPGAAALHDITAQGAPVIYLVPNFLLPPAFNPGTPSGWDYKGALASQYDVAPYGYVILRNIGVMMNQEKGEATLKRIVRIQGALVGSLTGPHADARLERKKHPVSRTYQRGIRIGTAV